MISARARSRLGKNMIIVHGDTHLLLQDWTHEENGFVVIGCSPFDQTAQGHFQDAYDWVWPVGMPEIGGGLFVQQYHRLTWSDDGSAITFTAEAFSQTGDIFPPGIVKTSSWTYDPTDHTT